MEERVTMLNITEGQIQLQRVTDQSQSGILIDLNLDEVLLDPPEEEKEEDDYGDNYSDDD